MASSAVEPLIAACLELINALRESGTLASKGPFTRNDLDFSGLLRAFENAKLEALAEFAAGAGHEINNPAATIAGRASLLLKSETDPERRRALETIGGQAYRIRDMIGDAMAFGRPPGSKPHQFAAAPIIEQYLKVIHYEINTEQFELSCSLDDSILIYADQQQFEVALSVLLRNVAETPELEEARASLSLHRSLRDPALAELRIENSGRILKPSDVEQFLDPFYSGRSAGRGLGFGLSKCWQLVRLNHGEIELTPSEGGGLAVTTFWQMSAPESCDISG